MIIISIKIQIPTNLITLSICPYSLVNTGTNSSPSIKFHPYDQEPHDLMPKYSQLCLKAVYPLINLKYEAICMKSKIFIRTTDLFRIKTGNMKIIRTNVVAI